MKFSKEYLKNVIKEETIKQIKESLYDMNYGKEVNLASIGINKTLPPGVKVYERGDNYDIRIEGFKMFNESLPKDPTILSAFLTQVDSELAKRRKANAENLKALQSIDPSGYDQ